MPGPGFRGLRAFPASASVSVIIPLFNLRGYVAESIESALAQTVPVEVVVIDDGSTDGGGDVVQGYAARVRYVRQQNAGLSAARNAGMRAASAPYLTFLDADDRIHPRKLEAQLAIFDRRPEVGIVYTGHRCIGPGGEVLPQTMTPSLEGDLLSRLLLGNLVPPHSPVIPRAVADDVGGFDEHLTSAEDWDFWLRIASRRISWACVPEILADYRIRADAMHQNPARMAANRMRVLEGFLAGASPLPLSQDLRSLARQRAALISAAEHYGVGMREDGARWFVTAVRERSALLTDTEQLAQFCRWMLPVGYQTDTLMAAQWRWLALNMRHAVAAVAAAPTLAPTVRALAWPIRVAWLRTVAPWVRKRARAALPVGRRRARLVAQRRALRAFYRSARA